MAADKRFDVVFCSDLQRSIETAQLAFGTKYKMIIDKRLRECNYGEMNGKNNMTDYIASPFPNGESYRYVENRLSSFVKYLLQGYDSKRIAIIAHQAPQLALDVLLLGKDWQQAINEDWRKTKSWKPGWDYVLGS